jgi:hypothetical protein
MKPKARFEKINKIKLSARLMRKTRTDELKLQGC